MRAIRAASAAIALVIAAEAAVAAGAGSAAKAGTSRRLPLATPTEVVTAPQNSRDDAMFFPPINSATPSTGNDLLSTIPADKLTDRLDSTSTSDPTFGERSFKAPSDAAPENPLTIGGQFYLRASTSARMSKDPAFKDRPGPPSAWTLSVPMLVDGYFDARPNDRVRAMLVSRLSYDPTLDPNGRSTFGIPSQPQTRVLLDQLWMKFDVAQTLFVTAGKQHVKWGTARFWNHTDFLHPVRRDPLAQFDSRSGVSMVKLHLPWEKQGWNLYSVGFIDDNVPASAVGKVGGAVRAEIVAGKSEIGLEAVGQIKRKPRLGADLSAAVGPIDVYGEAVLRKGYDLPLVRVAAVENPMLGLDGLCERYAIEAWTHSITGGFSFDVGYGDNDVLTIGAEYSYNSVERAHPGDYPCMLASGGFAAFDLARNYAGLFVLAMAPGRLDNTTFVLSALGNLSDGSYLTRLDWLVTVLTHLKFEAFASVHYGARHGEFRLGVDSPEKSFLANPLDPSSKVVVFPEIHLPPQVFDLGLGLRLNI